MKVPPGNQLRYHEEIEIVGAPKNDFTPAPSNGHASTSEIGQVLAMMREDRQMFMAALERLSGAGSSQKAVEQALLLNGQVFSSAMPAVVKTLENVGGGSHSSSSNGMDEITKEFMRAAISKMMNPSDPIEAFSKMAAAMGNLGYKMGGNPNGGLATELARGLISALPQLAAHVGGIMDQYRRAEEAKLEQVKIMRGAPAHVLPRLRLRSAAAARNVIEMQPPRGDAGPYAAQSEQTMQTEQLFSTWNRNWWSCSAA